MYNTPDKFLIQMSSFDIIFLTSSGFPILLEKKFTYIKVWLSHKSYFISNLLLVLPNSFFQDFLYFSRGKGGHAAEEMSPRRALKVGRCIFTNYIFIIARGLVCCQKINNTWRQKSFYFQIGCLFKIQIWGLLYIYVVSCNHLSSMRNWL